MMKAVPQGNTVKGSFPLQKLLFSKTQCMARGMELKKKIVHVTNLRRDKGYFSIACKVEFVKIVFSLMIGANCELSCWYQEKHLWIFAYSTSMIY